MKYQIGEKVRVKTWDELLEVGEMDFVEEMSEYCGRIVTISDIDCGDYSIEEDDGVFTWEDDMFKPLKFKVGDIIVGNENNEYILTHEGVKCQVTEVLDESDGYDDIEVVILDDEDYTEFQVCSEYFDLVEEKVEEEIETFENPFKVGDIVTGIENNGCGITTNESVCKVIEIISPHRMTVEVLEHLNKHKRYTIGNVYDVDSNMFMSIRDSSDVENKELVHHPDHYNTGKIEVIDVIEDWKLNFNLGNAIKYIGRCEHKGSKVEDLKKTMWYIQRELDVLEKQK